VVVESVDGELHVDPNKIIANVVMAMGKRLNVRAGICVGQTDQPTRND
jgi:hypothetical protein